jgi:hypothetical protein
MRGRGGEWEGGEGGSREGKGGEGRGREGRRREGIGLWTGPHQVWKEIDAYESYCPVNKNILYLMKMLCIHIDQLKEC